eukprot:2411937-Pyramimonas_sp.AAC.1
MSHAFGCWKLSELRRAVEDSIAGPDQAHCHHWHEHGTFTIVGSDGELSMHNGCGAFMGDGPAAEFRWLFDGQSRGC